MLCVLPVLWMAAVAADVGASPLQRSQAPPPVAIVARVTGEARVDQPSERRLRLFDRLNAGETIRTAAGAEVVVVFRSGARVRIASSSHARIDAAGARRIEGAVEPMSPVSPVPLVAPVSGAGTTITAVRIRAGGLTVVQPTNDTATLADQTVLEVEPVASDDYEMEIEGPDASIAFRVRGRHTRVAVPPGVLRPGLGYRWRVVAHLATGFESTGEGRFHTIGEQETRERARLRETLSTTDAGHLGLLAEVDRTLGLLDEALAGFRAAREAGASDDVIAERIAELERRRSGRPAPLVDGTH